MILLIRLIQNLTYPVKSVVKKYHVDRKMLGRWKNNKQELNDSTNRGLRQSF